MCPSLLAMGKGVPSNVVAWHPLPQSTRSLLASAASYNCYHASTQCQHCCWLGHCCGVCLQCVKRNGFALSEFDSRDRDNAIPAAPGHYISGRIETVCTHQIIAGIIKIQDYIWQLCYLPNSAKARNRSCECEGEWCCPAIVSCANGCPFSSREASLYSKAPASIPSTNGI